MDRVVANLRRALRAARALQKLYVRTVAEALGVPYPIPTLPITPAEFRQWLQQQAEPLVGRGRISPWLSMFGPYLARLGAQGWAYDLARDDTPLARYLNERLGGELYIGGPSSPLVFLRDAFGVPFVRLPEWAHAFDKRVQRRPGTTVTKGEALRALDEVAANWQRRPTTRNGGVQPL
jgi:hypothetical protein